MSRRWMLHSPRKIKGQVSLQNMAAYDVIRAGRGRIYAQDRRSWHDMHFLRNVSTITDQRPACRISCHGDPCPGRMAMLL